MWNSVKITVSLSDYDVRDFNVETCISATATPSAHYVNKIFMWRFTRKNVELAIGTKFDIGSLLDYAIMIYRQHQEILELEDELTLSHSLRMDSNFKYFLFDVI